MWNQLMLLAWRGGTTFFLNSANKIEECKIKLMTIGVLTRILSGTIFDKIGTKKSNLALKRPIRKTDTQVSASHVTL